MLNTESFYTYLISERRYSPLTLSAYRSDLEQFFLFCRAQFEITEPREVTISVVRSWLASLLDRQLAATSVHRKLASVSAYFRFLRKNGVIKTNPAKGIPKPKKPGRLPNFMEESAAVRIYEKANAEHTSFSDLRDQLIILLLYETGIRQAELLNLKDLDIDFYNGQIKVTGKRNKMRIVPVCKELLDRIKKYQQFRNKEFPIKTCDNLILTDKGKKNTKTFVYEKVTRYLANVTTMQKKSPHMLRHTFATHMLNNGADLNVIKEILGHANLAATQIYTHNHIEKLKRVHQLAHPRNQINTP